MFTNISWGNFITVVVLVSAGWYIFVGLRYYLSEFKFFISHKGRLNSRTLDNDGYIGQVDSPVSENKEYTTPAGSFEEMGNDLFDQIEEVIKRVKETVASASKINLVRQELLDYLSLILQEYPSLKSSDFRPSLNELIVHECQKIEQVNLTQEEADLLWS